MEGEFNEGLTLSPFTPTIKLIDVYGGENMESVGQCQNAECQSELYVVGVKPPANGKAPMIWIKHYKNGILSVDDLDDGSDSASSEEADLKKPAKGKKK